jgi:hypothetical protein
MKGGTVTSGTWTSESCGRNLDLDLDVDLDVDH